MKKSSEDQALQVGPEWVPCHNVPYAHPPKSHQNLFIVLRFILI